MTIYYDSAAHLQKIEEKINNRGARRAPLIAKTAVAGVGVKTPPVSCEVGRQSER